MTAIKKMLLTLSVVLTLTGVAGAASTFSFEPPTYTAGLPLEGQDGWIRNGAAAGDVINTDSTHGIQSVFNPAGAFNFDRPLGEIYTAAQTTYFKFDMKGAGYVDLLAAGAAKVEIGFDPGFQAWSAAPGNFTPEGSKPDTFRWVTVWGKLYDGGGGMRRMDTGWCELNQTPWVDGLRVAAHLTVGDNIDGISFKSAGSRNPNGIGIDNLYIGTQVPEPDTCVLLGTALFGLLVWRNRRWQKVATGAN